jgi:predicted dehydrogenase/aryl-alcohol dehydrogenase-like predicted oxidoreductase
MSTSTLRWGIIGPGKIAQKFATALNTSEYGTLQAVASRDLSRAQSFAKEFKAPAAYADYPALLNDPEVDAVYIATPHPHHTEWAIKAARAGKHILCEKPVALNHPQAMAIIEEAEINDVFFMEAFMYRCHPQTAYVVNCIARGKIGEVKMIRAHFGFHAGDNTDGRLLNNDLGGGGILDVGCYPMSFARLVAGAATGKPFAEPENIKALGQLHEQTGVDIYSSAILRFPGGILAEISTAVQVNLGAGAEIIGTEGKLTITSPWFCKGEVILEEYQGKTRRKKFKHKEHLYSHEIEAVARHSVQRQAPSPAMSPGDTLGNMKALDQWRSQIELTYRQETLTAAPGTMDGEPLGAAGSLIPKIPFPGLSLPASKVVMGCVDHRSLPAAMVMFDDFFRKGGNAFDTGTIYRGFDSRPSWIGQWMQLRGVREQCILIDKGAHTPHNFPHLMEKEMEKALTNHGTDYVDVYMMHRDNPDIPVGEFIDVLNRMTDAGTCRVYGLSNWTRDRFMEAVSYAQSHQLQPPVCLSNQFSLSRLYHSPWPGCYSCSDDEFRNWLEETQTAILPWSSQAGGFFSDKSASDKISDETFAKCWYSDDNFERKKRAQKLADDTGVSMLNISLAYVLNQPFPTFPLIGPQTLKETRTSLPALDVRLTPAEIAWLDLRD